MSDDKARILVVDDEPHCVEILQTLLINGGYSVFVVRDGETAVELALEDEPDLIILDAKLPGLDGYEVCRRIRSTSSTPIIMLSGLAQMPDRIRGLRMGADDYVVKPFDCEELLARVGALLRRVAYSKRRSAWRVFTAAALQAILVR